MGELEVSAASSEVTNGSEYVLDGLGHHSWLVSDVNLDFKRAYKLEVPIEDLDALLGQCHIPS